MTNRTASQYRAMDTDTLAAIRDTTRRTVERLDAKGSAYAANADRAAAELKLIERILAERGPVDVVATVERPTRGGQAVRGPEGGIGITTGEPAVRTPTIAVMWLGMPYETRAQLADLVVIDITSTK